MPQPLDDTQKLDRFFRSQGVPRFSRDAQLELLSEKSRKAIIAGVGNDGGVTPEAVTAYQSAIDEHRVKVREAAEKRESPRVEADEQKDAAPAEAIHPVEKAVTAPPVKSRKKPAKSGA